MGDKDMLIQIAKTGSCEHIRCSQCPLRVSDYDEIPQACFNKSTDAVAELATKILYNIEFKETIDKELQGV